jgi:glycosyltransferase involved in cell wall biosynthesis
MTISFVVPVYNCGTLLKPCIDSLLAVRNTELEILLIDDGSTDGSGALCDSLQAADPRICCIHQDNQGVSAARNRGIAEAAGDYVVFVDADDTLDSILFSDLLQSLGPEPDTDLVLFGLSFDYYRKGVLYRSTRMQHRKCGTMERKLWKNEISALYHCNYLSPVWNKLFRRSFLLRNDLRFDTDMFLLEDLHFSLRALSFADSIVCSDAAIYHYRQAEDEGNAGRRLKRIERVSSLIDQLQAAFSMLADHLEQDPHTYDDLLASIFLMLVRQKVQVSDFAEIGAVCDDFCGWQMKREISPSVLSGKYAQKVLTRRVLWLYCRSRYSSVRHQVANRVKYLRNQRKRTEARG